MPITDLAQLRTALDEGLRVSASKQAPSSYITGGVYNGQIWDYWDAIGYPAAGANPTTLAGTLYTKASTGAIPLSGTTSGSTYALASVQASCFYNAATPTSLLPANGGTEFFVHIWDRVWANQISMATTSRQAWTPPALTRYVTGEGLRVFWRWNTIFDFGAVTTNITLEYTNQDGVNRTFVSSHRLQDNFVVHAPLMIPLPLQATDTGVRAVTAITINQSVAAGNTAQLVLMRYLGAYRITPSPEGAAALSPFSGMPQFDGNACLAFGIQTGTAFNTLYTAGAMPRVALEAKVLPL